MATDRKKRTSKSASTRKTKSKTKPATKSKTKRSTKTKPTTKTKPRSKAKATRKGKSPATSTMDTSVDAEVVSELPPLAFEVEIRELLETVDGRHRLRARSAAMVAGALADREAVERSKALRQVVDSAEKSYLERDVERRLIDLERRLAELAELEHEARQNPSPAPSHGRNGGRRGASA